MAFKVKNLMIHIIPNADEKSQLQLVPGLAQDYVCNNWISLYFPCFFLSTGLPHLPDQDGYWSDPIALAILKVQLQEALASVQEQEQAINEKMRLKTVEEAQALEEELVVALEEVRQQKEQLKNNASGGQE